MAGGQVHLLPAIDPCASPLGSLEGGCLSGLLGLLLPAVGLRLCTVLWLLRAGKDATKQMAKLLHCEPFFVGVLHDCKA